MVGKDNILRIIRSIRFFKDISEKQIESILSISQEKEFGPNTKIIEMGSKSSELFILISGELTVESSNNSVAKITELGIVGEMGVFTGQPRSADVVTSCDSKLLVIQGEDLINMIEAEKDLGLQLYRNIIYILASHLKNNNFALEFSHMMDDIELNS